MRNVILLSSFAMILYGCGGGETPKASRPRDPSAASEGGADHPPMTPLNANADDPDDLQEALDRNPGHSPILMRMAELALQNGDAAKAVEHLRAVIEAEPDNLDARLELGRALYESGDVESAQTETETLVERDANNVDALYNLGAIHANQKRPERAVEYWTRAVAAAPGSPSGQNAQRGLDVLAGRRASMREIPDIPEHRGITQPKSSQPNRLDSSTRERLIEFANKASDR